ncbi:hypothetical protein M5689_002388 [Euphorbia peplus]|nr:hypothetical protein M5689_002388 [Euphorbia peplus]
MNQSRKPIFLTFFFPDSKQSRVQDAQEHPFEESQREATTPSNSVIFLLVLSSSNPTGRSLHGRKRGNNSINSALIPGKDNQCIPSPVCSDQ